MLDHQSMIVAQHHAPIVKQSLSPNKQTTTTTAESTQVQPHPNSSTNTTRTNSPAGSAASPSTKQAINNSRTLDMSDAQQPSSSSSNASLAAPKKESLQQESKSTAIKTESQHNYSHNESQMQLDSDTNHESSNSTQLPVSQMKSEVALASQQTPPLHADAILPAVDESAADATTTGRRPRRSTVSAMAEQKAKAKAEAAELAAKRAAKRPEAEAKINEQFDHFNCAECEGTGDVVMCNGPCRRVWHYTCVPCALPANLVTDEWLCKECSTARHECPVCRQTGDDDVDVFQCGGRACGRFYHKQCVLSLPLTRVLRANADGTGQMTRFICPHHACKNCWQIQQEANQQQECKNNSRAVKLQQQPTSSKMQPISSTPQLTGVAASTAPQCGGSPCTPSSSAQQSHQQHASSAAGVTSARSSATTTQTRKRKANKDNRTKSGAIVRCTRCTVALHAKGCLMPDVAKRFQGCWMICDTTLPGHEPLRTTDRDAEDCELDVEIPPVVVWKADQEQSQQQQQQDSMTDAVDDEQQALQLFENDVIWLAPKRQDFRLPEALIRTAESQRVHQGAPAPYKRIATNHYNEEFVTRPCANLDSRVEPCDCRAQNDLCDENCLNRAVYTECSVQCANGDQCHNQRLRRRQWAKTKVVNCADKGFGLQVLQDVREGDLIIEYCGEIISGDECASRLERNHAIGVHDFYMFKISSEYVIDATNSGSHARFINHDCRPNCRTQLWSVGAHQRVGIFALKPIAAGTELTYDYCCTGYWPDGQAQKCHCGSANCRGYLGAKPVKVEKTELTDKQKKKIKSAREKAKRLAKKEAQAAKQAADPDATETESEGDVARASIATASSASGQPLHVAFDADSSSGTASEATASAPASKQSSPHAQQPLASVQPMQLSQV